MSNPKNRFRLLSAFVLFFALLLIGKLYFIQIVSGEKFQARAEQQYLTGANYFDRGLIYFTAKEGGLVPAAGIETGFSLFINPSILSRRTDLENIYTKVNEITEIDREDFFTRVSKTNDPYEVLAKQLPKEIADKIQALNVSGVSVTKERWRVYPGGRTAAHTIGLIGFNGNQLAGRYGLERFYEPILKRDGKDVFINFFAEIFSNLKKAVSKDENLNGSIITTIEPTVQSFVESALDKVQERYASEFTGGLVLDPKTGEIYAMALMPAFDPNLPQNEDDARVFSNKFVEDRYEMGSIIKALTLAIGLESKAITAKTTYNDAGCLTLNTKTFCNFDRKSHGSNLSMQIVLNKSLNTGAAFVASKVGSEEFGKAMLSFGLDGLTGIDLPNEGKSLVSNLRTGRDLEIAQASFGQGIALTPIMTARALSALANGGTLITPHLAREVKYDLGVTKALTYPNEEERVRVLGPETSAEISRMLVENVDRSLREGRVRLDQYSIAAKTGTAQIARPGVGGYYDDRYLHSFFGYFPAYEPEFLIFLFTYYPKGVRFASETLTDSFFDISKFLINYYEIPPDREAPPPSRSE